MKKLIALVLVLFLLGCEPLPNKPNQEKKDIIDWSTGTEFSVYSYCPDEILCYGVQGKGLISCIHDKELSERYCK